MNENILLRRTVAYLIDILIATLPLSIVFWLHLAKISFVLIWLIVCVNSFFLYFFPIEWVLYGITHATTTTDLPSKELFLFGYLFLVFYFLILSTFILKKSIGKKIMRINIVSINTDIENHYFIIRTLIKLLFIFSTVFTPISYLLMLLTPKNQTIHDLICKTSVVYDKTKNADIPNQK